MGDPSDRLLVALDVDGLDQAATLLDTLSGVVTGCKIGNQLFTAAGPAAVEAARKRGFRVFLDLKYHDIPNTVAGAVREATRLGVFMLNVHAGGGLAMMRAAAEAATRAAKDLAVPRPICLGVTVLTSLDRHALDAELAHLVNDLDGREPCTPSGRTGESRGARRLRGLGARDRPAAAPVREEIRHRDARDSRAPRRWGEWSSRFTQ